MKTPKIANAMGQIDDELVVAAENSKTKAIRNPLLKWGSLAACFTAIIAVGITILPTFFGSNTTTDPKDDRYKDYEFLIADSAFIWPWEYLTSAEKYTELTINNIKYMRHGSAVVESSLKDFIGTYAVFGYDEYTDETPSKDFDVYSLKYADISQFVAVKIEDEYYVFKNDIYSPPATLGELLDLVDLESAIELNRFSENGDSPTDKHFCLNNDDYVWDVLKECKTAPFVEDQEWNAMERNYISFSISSETLGIYRLVMYITEDGYLWTNAFSWQYLFNIGEDAAEKIIKYAKENSKKAEYEPYSKYIIGTITEITDEYFVIDDSILCKDPADGITYKVLLNSFNISRYIDIGKVKLGDTVRVFTKVDFGESKQNIISDATVIDKATIIDGETFINE